MLVIIYVSCLVAANLLVHTFGPWFSPINAFILIGLDMVIRDKLHDSWKVHLYPKMFALIVSAGLVTYLLNPSAGMVAVASSVSFVLAMLVNTGVYQLVKTRPWLVRSNFSNFWASITDSIIFPTIAFGYLMPEVVILQFIAKFSGGFIWSVVFKKLNLVGK